MRHCNLALFVRVLIAICLAGTSAQAQSRAAEKAYQKGQDYYRFRAFPEAMKQYRKAVEADSTYAQAWLQLAGMHRLYGEELQEYQAASAYLRHAKFDDPNRLKILLSTARLSMKYNGFANFRPRLEELINSGTVRIDIVNDAKALIDRYEFASKVPHYDLNLKELPAPINQMALQYFPSLTANEELLVFTARKSTDQQADEDMYLSRRRNGQWEVPKSMSSALNSQLNEGTAQISADGRTLVFASCLPGQGCDLYISKYRGGQWGEPQPIAEINTKYWESQPCVSADGRKLYFVSDRPGGQGGTDIWSSELDNNGHWLPAQNAGSVINTTENEYCPYLHPNLRSLFFSSAGHFGLGGQDLFVSHLKDDNEWGTPMNLGVPINSPLQEGSIFVNALGTTGYISREKGEGSRLSASRLYSFTLPKEWALPGPNVVLSGRVYATGSNEGQAAELDLVNLATGQVVYRFFSDDNTGDYLIVLAQGSEFGLFARPVDNAYLPASIYFNLDKSDSLTAGKTVNIALSKRTKGSTARLNTVYFETGKFDLPKSARPELDNVARYMTQNPTLRIEIGGHTDDVGGDAANVTLSQKRAESIVAYLTAKGIAKTRITAKGYGKSMPARPNNSDANRAFNRRIEAKVL